jgi:hypothetical protein
MKRWALATILAAATIGCAVAPEPAPVSGSRSLSCIDTDQVIGRRVAGPGAIEFDVLGGTTYRNELASACPGLDRLGKAAVVGVTSTSGGSRLCSSDRVRVFDPVEAKTVGLRGYPECLLGRFVPIPR